MSNSEESTFLRLYAQYVALNGLLNPTPEQSQMLDAVKRKLMALDCVKKEKVQ